MAVLHCRMALGKLSDYTKFYAPKGIDPKLKTPEAKTKAKYALGSYLAAFQYFSQTWGSVLINDAADGGTALLGFENDYMSVVPDGALYKAFSKAGCIGFVVENVFKQLELYDPTKDVKKDDSKKTYKDLEYDLAGSQGKSAVYARLDRVAIGKLLAGQHLNANQLNQYETSMRKGLIPSGSTGADGIKFDQVAWVVKITISIAQANQMDNTLSPMADEVRDGNDIYLNFNQLAHRH